MHHYISVLRLNFRHGFPGKKVKEIKLLKCKCTEPDTTEPSTPEAHEYSSK